MLHSPSSYLKSPLYNLNSPSSPFLPLSLLKSIGYLTQNSVIFDKMSASAACTACSFFQVCQCLELGTVTVHKIHNARCSTQNRVNNIAKLSPISIHLTRSDSVASTYLNLQLKWFPHHLNDFARTSSIDQFPKITSRKLPHMNYFTWTSSVIKTSFEPQLSCS